MTADPIQWLLTSYEPWFRYRTLLDLQDRSEDDPEVKKSRAEMVDVITVQADDDGRHAAISMYRTQEDWSFADKKQPEAWLAFLVYNLLKQCRV